MVTRPDFGGDGYQTEQEMRRWAADVEAKAQRYQVMQDEVATVQVTESSADEVVRVTVNATGVVTDLVIAERHREVPGRELSALVLTTMRTAQSRIAEQVAEVMERTVGDDPQTVAAVVGSYRQRFPEPDPDPERPTGGHAGDMRLGEVEDDPGPRQARGRSPRDDEDDEWGGGSILR